MPAFGLDDPSEFWGGDSAELRRGQPAEPGAGPVRRRRRQVAGGGVCQIGSTLISSAF